MAGLEIINQHPLLTAAIVVGGFVTYKFIILPIMNEGKPLDPTQDQIDPPPIIDTSMIGIESPED